MKFLFLICAVGLAAVFTASAQTRTLRIVSYNIEANTATNSVKPAAPGQFYPLRAK